MFYQRKFEWTAKKLLQLKSQWLNLVVNFHDGYLSQHHSSKEMCFSGQDEKWAWANSVWLSYLCLSTHDCFSGCSSGQILWAEFVPILFKCQTTCLNVTNLASSFFFSLFHWFVFDSFRSELSLPSYLLPFIGLRWVLPVTKWISWSTDIFKNQVCVTNACETYWRCLCEE